MKYYCNSGNVLAIRVELLLPWRFCNQPAGVQPLCSLLSAKTLGLSDSLGAVMLLYQTLAFTAGRDMRAMLCEGIITTGQASQHS